ncbi:hypothetical protein NITHO_1850002 [Nitrolancea hollandica Lb]|uniref:Uncharacterized protein n=1 Tax=Nitrolancea hollandica Lb TaxID=1129897 RepID=I4EEI8_9BACT|nr:hypothetical protein NITHO_1850002 [Nitrolancea hollandica Lb]
MRAPVVHHAAVGGCMRTGRCKDERRSLAWHWLCGAFPDGLALAGGVAGGDAFPCMTVDVKRLGRLGAIRREQIWRRQHPT